MKLDVKSSVYFVGESSAYKLVYQQTSSLASIDQSDVRGREYCRFIPREESRKEFFFHQLAISLNSLPSGLECHSNETCN